MKRLLSLLAVVALSAGCSQSTPPAQPAAQAPAPAPGPAPMRKAEPGVGAKGQNLGTGPVATPIKAYFRTKEKIAFDIQLQSALQIYNATNGKNPKDHDEFMRVIIAENRIKLPELPAGEEYFYDPAEGSYGTLFVRPAQ